MCGLNDPTAKISLQAKIMNFVGFIILVSNSYNRLV